MDLMETQSTLSKKRRKKRNGSKGEGNGEGEEGGEEGRAGQDGCFHFGTRPRICQQKVSDHSVTI